jgi:hypothetical protein
MKILMVALLHCTSFRWTGTIEEQAMIFIGLMF